MTAEPNEVTPLARYLHKSPEAKYLYKVPEAAAILSMSRSVLYEQIRAGRLRVVHQGRACLVSARAISNYIALLEKEAEEIYGKTA